MIASSLVLGLNSVPVMAPVMGKTLLADVLPWAGLLAIITLVGGGIAVFVRRNIFVGSEPTVGFTLEDLREMRAKGEITDEEFELSRARMTQAFRESGSPDDRLAGLASANRIPGVKPPPRRSSQGPKSPPSDGSASDVEKG